MLFSQSHSCMRLFLDRYRALMWMKWVSYKFLSLDITFDDVRNASTQLYQLDRPSNRWKEKLDPFVCYEWTSYMVWSCEQKQIQQAMERRVTCTVCWLPVV